MIGESIVPAGKPNGDPFIVELANEKPTKPEDRDKVTTYFIDPMLAEFQKVSSDEGLVSSWASFLRIELAGNSVDVLRAAALHFKRNGWTEDPRSKGFMPPTEVILKKVHELHYQSPEGKLERALAYYDGMQVDFDKARDIWSRQKLGPWIGKEGCILSASMQAALWRKWLADLKGDIGPEYPLALSVLIRWHIKVSADPCPIPLDVLDEFDLRITNDEFAALQADYKARRMAEHERQRAENEAANKRRDEELARKKSEENAKWVAGEREAVLRKAELFWEVTMGRNFRVDVPATPKPEMGRYSWPSSFGPLPGQPGSFMMPEVQEKFGFTAHESTVEYWRLRRQHHLRDHARADVNWYRDTGKTPDCRDVLDRATEVADGIRILKPLLVRDRAC